MNVKASGGRYHERIGNLRPADVYFGRSRLRLVHDREVKDRVLALGD